MNKIILNLLFALLTLPVSAEIKGSPSTTQVIIRNKLHFTEVSPPADMPDANRTSGDFIIPSAKQFEVEYSDKVVLAPGFKVNKGGIFKARFGASTYKNR